MLPDGVASLVAGLGAAAEQLTDPSTRYRLLPLMRFCSGTGIEPEAVDEAVIDRYFDHRARTTNRPVDAANRRILARLWNACVGKIGGWPNIAAHRAAGQDRRRLRPGRTSRRACARTSTPI